MVGLRESDFKFLDEFRIDASFKKNDYVRLEIAYQLGRIADALERFEQKGD